MTAMISLSVFIGILAVIPVTIYTHGLAAYRDSHIADLSFRQKLRYAVRDSKERVAIGAVIQAVFIILFLLGRFSV